MFPQQRKQLTERDCQERWTQIHLNRKYKIDERKQVREEKKILSIMAFEDPRKMFTARELIEELELDEKKRKEEAKTVSLIEEPTLNKRKTSNSSGERNNGASGFNVLKDSVMRIDPGKKQEMEQQFLRALEKAKVIDDDMCEKPFFYRPKFICDNQYELEREDLTKQKAAEIATSTILLNNYIGEFTKNASIEIPDYKPRYVQERQITEKIMLKSAPEKSEFLDEGEEAKSEQDEFEEVVVQQQVRETKVRMVPTGLRTRGRLGFLDESDEEQQQDDEYD